MILDDKNEIVSFSTKNHKKIIETKKVRQIRKNLSDSDLHEEDTDDVDDSSDDSMDSDDSNQTNVNPWSSRLHSTDFNIRKKCGKWFLFLDYFSKLCEKLTIKKLFEKSIALRGSTTV